MKCEFVDAEKAQWSVVRMCKMLKFSPKTYYAWRSRGVSAHKLADEKLMVHIKAAFEASRATYGSPRVHAALTAEGIKVGRKRVARLMRENGLVVQPRRGFRCTTTERDPAHEVAPNTLDRDFEANGPNEKWVTDVTSIRTGQGWLYLATMLDLFNREIVGWAMDSTNDQLLTKRALDMALQSHKPPKGLLHHSDRGSTYTAGDYRDALATNGIEASMSRKGNCWDNAVAESFFATLKKELVHRQRFNTHKQAKAAIFEYIEVFYNRVRLHSTLGYKTPVQLRTENTTPVT